MFRQWQYPAKVEGQAADVSSPVSQWVQPQSQPIPNSWIKKTAGYAIALAAAAGMMFIGLPPAAEAVSADRWVQPQSQPYPYRKNLATANQQACFWSTYTPPVQSQASGISSDLLRIRFQKKFASQSPPFFWDSTQAPENVTA